MNTALTLKDWDEEEGTLGSFFGCILMVIEENCHINKSWKQMMTLVTRRTWETLLKVAFQIACNIQIQS